MTAALALPAATDPPARPEDVAERLRGYARASKAEATWRAYAADWRCFTTWCADHGRASLPAAPDTVAAYLACLAERRKPSTLARRIASIAQAHSAAGHDSPTTSAEVRLVWSGIRRSLGVSTRQAQAATIDVVRRMVDALDDRPIGVRDRALLLLGFAGALRRSELVALDAADLTPVVEGLAVRLRASKTDQEAAGATVAVPYGSRPDTCPVRAVAAWLDVAGVVSGPVFRPVTRHGHVGGGRLSGRAASEVVKRCAQRAGLDPDRFSGHSLRAGFATTAGANGVAERHIARQTRHASLAVLRSYIRDGDQWRDNAASAVGL